MNWYWLGFLPPLFLVMGLLNAIHALRHVRTSQGTIAWVLSLIFMPFLAVPLYWILGKHHFDGYVDSRRKRDWEEGDEIGRKLIATLKSSRPDAGHPLVKVAEKVSGLSLCEGNAVKLLIDGDETYAEMLAAIKRAEAYIVITFYTVMDDEIGGDFKKALIEKARAGVKICFLYDDIGSHNLPGDYLDELRDEGVKISCFGATRRLFRRWQMNFRNHRKIVVVDGREALVGGLNVGDDYRGLNPKFGEWRDTHLHLRGPAVKAVQLVFIEDWHWATGELPDLNWEIDHQNEEENRRVLVVPTGPSDPLDSCHLLFIEAANTARKNLWIATPYFVPDDAVVKALQAASLRGVQVRLLIPEKPDSLPVYLSSFSYLDEMEDAGIEVFRYQAGFLHQKVFLVDDEICSVGTANFDNRSFRLNFEISVLIDDPEFSREVREMLKIDFAKATPVRPGELSEKGFLFRTGVALARLSAPIQ